MAEPPALTLYQTEWCPFSTAVREVLTELGIDVVLRQVEPWPEQREELRALAGTDRIPVLQAEDGQLYRGTREIFALLRDREPWRFETGHRRRFAAHHDARVSDVPAQLVEYFRHTDELEAVEEPGTPDDAVVVDVPEQNRYELRLDGKLIGLLAYHRRDGRIAFTHTEVDPSCERRGFGSLLAARALDDARREGLTVAPLCPFVARYIDKHPEYRELVAQEPETGS
jgi:predicted GNAT family acetyltransferase/glutaredoxin